MFLSRCDDALLNLPSGLVGIGVMTAVLSHVITHPVHCLVTLLLVVVVASVGTLFLL